MRTHCIECGIELNPEKIRIYFGFQYCEKHYELKLADHKMVEGYLMLEELREI